VSLFKTAVVLTQILIARNSGVDACAGQRPRPFANQFALPTSLSRLCRLRAANPSSTVISAGLRRRCGQRATVISLYFVT
jgi:hypothetical protein